jgi:hypothetical protein
MLIFTEGGKPENPENPEKNPLGKGENNTSNKLNSPVFMVNLFSFMVNQTTNLIPRACLAFWSVC